jgi:hypothetical protein
LKFLLNDKDLRKELKKDEDRERRAAKANDAENYQL